MDNSSPNENITTKEEVPIKKIKLKKKYRNIIVSFLVLIIIIYFFGLFYYSQRFLPRVTLNTQNVSEMTIDEVKTKFKESKKEQLLLTFIDNKTETLNAQDCGFVYNEQNDIQKEFENQNKWLWFTSFFSKKDLQIDNIYSIDDALLNNQITKLSHLNPKNQVKPTDAKVIYKDNQFSIQEAIAGSTIDLDSFKKIVFTGFSNANNEINVKEHNGYVLPKKLEDNKNLTSLLEAANKYALASITYKTTTGDVVLDGNKIMTWLSIDENGDYYRNDEEFKKQATLFLEKELAPKLNIIGKSKTFTGAYNRKLSVSGGNYGYKLNVKKEVDALLKDIYENKKETRTPITTGIQASYQNGGLGDTFVELDMTKQHMWVHKNGSIVLESDIVTGMANDYNKRTPKGTYYIYFMQRNRTLIGEMQPNGKPEYETPVAYWMAFNRGIGLHDATWQPAFGGNLYYTKGSHGCINLPLNIAKQLYSLVKVNTPVVCYY